jgi:hypothetical protein
MEKEEGVLVVSTVSVTLYCSVHLVLSAVSMKLYCSFFGNLCSKCDVVL